VTYAPHVLHAIALLLVWRRLGHLAWLMLASMVCSWVIGYRATGVDRAVGMILLDLATILTIRAYFTGARARLVAAVSLGLIVLRTAYMAVPYMGHTVYAVTINSAFVVQLLIGGGMADDVGRWIDNRLSRIWPWGARALRHVAV